MTKDEILRILDRERSVWMARPYNQEGQARQIQSNQIKLAKALTYIIERLETSGG